MVKPSLTTTLRKLAGLGSCLMVLALPTSTNYTLRNYGFGGGGETGLSSNNYAAEATLDMSGDRLSGSNYKVWPGLVAAEMAAVPPAPTFTNPDSYYNKLKIVINVSDNPSDAQFAIAISPDAFVSTTRYVQSDGTLGATLGAEDWMTYTAWGGASGQIITGLSPSTTYTVKVKARHGDYTETPWGPTSSAATVNATLTFDIDVSTIDEESAAPYTLALGNLSPGSIITSSSKVWLDLSTNAVSGGLVYVYGSGTGLTSSSQSYTISAVSADLTGVGEGYGLQSSSVTQSSGGPLAASSPFNGASGNVGAVSTTPSLLYSSSAALSGGRSSFVSKAKITALTPAATDYTGTLTLVAAGRF